MDNQVFDMFMKQVEKLIDKKYEERKKKQTQIRPSIIVDDLGNNYYSVIIDGYEYKAFNGTGNELDLYQNVWVMIPHGRLEDMHIYSLRK